MAVNVGKAQGASTPTAPAIPFTRAAMWKTQQIGQFNFANTTTTNTVNSPIQIPAAGFLRGVEIIVTASGGTGTAAVYAADGPWNFINQISLSNSAGDNLIAPISGYQLYLLNKYGSGRAQAPWSDPKMDAFYTTPTNGNFQFRLFLPVEADPSQGFCALPNLAANRAYQVNYTVDGFATAATASKTDHLFSTLPTTVPSVNVTFVNHYWSQPAATNAVGTPQETQPFGTGSVMLTQVETYSTSSGDKYLQSHNVGNVIRGLGLVLRDANGVRLTTGSAGLGGSSAVASATPSQIILNNDTVYYLPYVSWIDHMAETYGLAYGGRTASSAYGFDAVGTLDNGVYWIGYFGSVENGYFSPSNSRDNYLPTLDATLLQIRANFGTISTCEIITQSVKPTSAAALYQPHFQ
jgi:hypothetical protein